MIGCYHGYMNDIKKKEIPELRADFSGNLKINDNLVPCAVLNNGKRVVIQREVVGLLTGNKKGGLDRYFSPPNLAEFVPEKFRGKTLDQATIKFVSKGKIAHGYEATDLIDICDMYLNARKAGKLLSNQRHLADQAEIIIRAFAKVGIIAVIDEVTGYQKEKNEYQKILELYIAKEIRPWISTFDDNYYVQLYRLLGWKWDAYKMKKKQHPQYIGKLTNRLIYEKLAPGVLEELQRINPKNDKGNRKTKHHQRLTENVGYRELIKRISAITILMEQFPDGDLPSAIQKIDARFPTYSPFYQTSMDFPVADKTRFDKVIMQASKPLLKSGKKVE